MTGPGLQARSRHEGNLNTQKSACAASPGPARVPHRCTRCPRQYVDLEGSKGGSLVYRAASP
eukprot:157127-Chlamydomonas_euryale.AAC.2